MDSTQRRRREVRTRARHERWSRRGHRRQGHRPRPGVAAPGGTGLESLA